MRTTTGSNGSRDADAVTADPAEAYAASPPVSVVVLGLGPVGAAVLRAAVTDRRFNVVACIDPRPDRAKIAADQGFGGAVHASLDETDQEGGIRVAMVCTSSRLEDVGPLAARLTHVGYDVVSTCEELIAPELADVDAVRDLREAAGRAGHTVIGAGVNPGFVMDVLPLLATMVSRDIHRISIVRKVNVAARRSRLQEKVGVGISLDEFQARRSRGTIGHVGLEASLVFLARSLGWTGESQEDLEPVVASDGTSSLGVRHRGRVVDLEGITRVEGLLEMYVGAEDIDHIIIDGSPRIELQAPQGIAGDEATVSAVLNAAASVQRMPPGLHTPAGVIPPTWRCREA
jgi:hypothetical protein